MSIGAKEHALLAQDSYRDRSAYVGKEKFVTLDGVDYKVLDTYSNPLTGYQGTAYRRVDTGEVVIAHRGTESVLDGVVDAGMVLSGLNSQIPNAEAFTKRVLEKAKAASAADGFPLSVTVTGHSLGGTLAEYTAYAFHLRADTFNAYGAAGLWHGVPEGDSRVINYVRATDVVSAASAHHGEVRVLATAHDIDALRRARFHEDGTGFWRHTLGAADLSAHGIANFVPDAQGHSALDPEHSARYRAHHAMVDRYRDDIRIARTALSIRWELEKRAMEVGQAASTAVGHAAVQGTQALAHTAEQVGQQVARGAAQATQAVGTAVDVARETVMQSAHALGQQAHLVGTVMGDGLRQMGQTLRHPGSLFDTAPAKPVGAHSPTRLDDPAHPDHSMFQQCLHGVRQLNTEHGVAHSSRDANIAGALAVAATTRGLTRINEVLLNDDASRVFAVQGTPWRFDQQYAAVDTMTAIHTPLEQSSAQWMQAAQQAEQTRQAAQQEHAWAPSLQASSPATGLSL